MNDVLDQVYCPNGPGIIFKDFGGEMVIANLDSGLFYSVGGFGGALWSALVTGHTGRQILAAFGDVDQNAVGSAIARFITELAADNVLVPTTAPNDVVALGPFEAFAPPSLERFDDLQGLLLVDPIHDVSEAGWPMISKTARTTE